MNGSNISPRRLFGVVPAAGHSRRMGQPKLLLPLGGRTVVCRLLESLKHPAVSAVAVVVRKDDQALAHEVREHGGWCIQPEENPPEMRESVEVAIREIESQHTPNPRDGWLLIPADHPVISPKLVDQLITIWQDSDAGIVVPRFGERRGHPVIFSWELAADVKNIPPDKGLNWLSRRFEHRVQEVESSDPEVLLDLDTPEDYERLRRRFSAQS